jgi:hypothetical protein
MVTALQTSALVSATRTAQYVKGAALATRVTATARAGAHLDGKKCRKHRKTERTCALCNTATHALQQCEATRSPSLSSAHSKLPQIQASVDIRLHYSRRFAGEYCRTVHCWSPNVFWIRTNSGALRRATRRQDTILVYHIKGKPHTGGVWAHGVGESAST